jgi:hypothetical protein
LIIYTFKQHLSQTASRKYGALQKSECVVALEIYFLSLLTYMDEKHLFETASRKYGAF